MEGHVRPDHNPGCHGEVGQGEQKPVQKSQKITPGDFSALISYSLTKFKKELCNFVRFVCYLRIYSFNVCLYNSVDSLD